MSQNCLVLVYWGSWPILDVIFLFPEQIRCTHTHSHTHTHPHHTVTSTPHTHTTQSYTHTHTHHSHIHTTHTHTNIYTTLIYIHIHTTHTHTPHSHIHTTHTHKYTPMFHEVDPEVNFLLFTNGKVICLLTWTLTLLNSNFNAIISLDVCTQPSVSGPDLL